MYYVYAYMYTYLYNNVVNQLENHPIKQPSASIYIYNIIIIIIPKRGAPWE